MTLALCTFTAPSAKSWRRTNEGDEQFFLQLPRTGLTQAERSPSWCCRAGASKGHSDGCAEDVGSVVLGQSYSSPSRHTWTSARFAAWLPESLVPRAGHGVDGTVYLICLSGFKHPKPPFCCSAHCSLPLSVSAGPGSPQLKNPLQKVKGGGSTSWVFSSVCDYYRCPGHSQSHLMPFAQKTRRWNKVFADLAL